jgi:hypothetical protein
VAFATGTKLASVPDVGFHVPPHAVGKELARGTEELEWLSA